MCHQKTIDAVARQEIEYLRRAYAIATDQIGEDTEASVTAGGEIYHQIFSPDVTFAVTGPETQPLTANGPKGWVDVVRGALGPLGPTQHLIGSQVVTFDDLQWNDRCEVVSGKAKMQSYVQAWQIRMIGKSGYSSVPILTRSFTNPSEAGRSATWNCVGSRVNCGRQALRSLQPRFELSAPQKVTSAGGFQMGPVKGRRF